MDYGPTCQQIFIIFILQYFSTDQLALQWWDFKEQRTQPLDEHKQQNLCVRNDRPIANLQPEFFFFNYVGNDHPIVNNVRNDHLTKTNNAWGMTIPSQFTYACTWGMTIPSYYALQHIELSWLLIIDTNNSVINNWSTYSIIIFLSPFLLIIGGPKNQSYPRHNCSFLRNWNLRISMYTWTNLLIWTLRKNTQKENRLKKASLYNHIIHQSPTLSRERFDTNLLTMEPFSNI